jgi:hypothetical protein
MADSDTQVPKDEKPEGEQPRIEYDIVPSKREEPDGKFTAAGQLYSAMANAHAEGHTADDEAALAQAQLARASSRGIKKLAASQTRVYAAIGIGLGLLVGFIAAYYFIQPGSQNGLDGLGSVSAATYGLKGHLTAKWGDRLSYRLTIEPSAPEQRAAFIAAVSNSPRPLSIGIQLKDPFGAVLCGNTVLVKFDPRNAPLPAAPQPKPGSKPGTKAAQAAEFAAQRAQIAHSIYLAQLESQELNREHGKDVFQNDAGSDGRIASISAQGTLPCTKKQFDGTATWGFAADFPVVAASQESQNAAPDSNANQSADQGSAGKTTDAAAKARRKSAAASSPIYVEGDDQIIWFDASTGALETSAGKALVIDKTDAVANALKSRDFPIAIHYRCDATGACTFAGIGTFIEHARLRR